MTDTTTPGADEWPHALGRTIKVWRTDIGMSRRQLAQSASISYSYLSAIENGAKTPSTKILRVLAERLGVRSQDLHAAAEERVAQGKASQDRGTDSDDRLIETQERRFLQRQQARFGQVPTDTSTAARSAELTELVSQLDEEDIAVLVAMARRLSSARPQSTPEIDT
jgi:transcriptional regulator with XRE-family HTH domain